MHKFLRTFWQYIVRIYRLIDEFGNRLDRHHVYLVSAGVAFNILLYLIPMLLVALYIINRMFGVEMITSFLTNFAEDMLPPNEFSKELISSTLREVNLIFGQSSAAGLIGLISLLWLSSTLFNSLRSGLNSVFEIETHKIFLVYRIKDIFMTLIIAVLILILSYATPLITLLKTNIQDLFGQPLKSIFSNLSVTLISLGSSFLLFFGLFRFVPNKRQAKFIVYLSTLLSTVCIEFSRHIFAWYVGKFGTYGKFYGTYAVIVSMAFWVYYMILILLISGEISSFIYEKKKKN